MSPRPRDLLLCAAAAAMVGSLGACKAKRTAATLSPDAAPVDASGGEGGREAKAPGAPPFAPEPVDDQLPASTEGMDLRARHLLEAVAGDNAALANDILFPRDGWTATRDTADPGKEWDRRVATPFRKAVHVLARHNEELVRAQSVTLELGSAIAKETPRPRAWKKPLWTVHGSRVKFVLDGRARTLPVRELTAWRGEWYVTLLR